MGMMVGCGLPHTVQPCGPKGKPFFSADNGTAEAMAATRYTGQIFIRDDNGPYSPPTEPEAGGGPVLSNGRRAPNQWSDVTNDTIGSFSAVCWYTGKELFERALAADGEPTPTGLIMAAVGGSPIEYWIPPSNPLEPLTNPCEVDNPQCDDELVDSTFWREYIQELLPYSISAVVWDQAERDVKCPKAMAAYPCLQKYLISSWKERFNSSFVFLGVQLAGYTAPLINGTGNYSPLTVTADMVWTMRMQQEKGCIGVPGCKVIPTYDFSCSAGVDGGCPYGSVHQPDKAGIGKRVGLQLYELLNPSSNVVVEGPRATAAVAVRSDTGHWNVTVNFTGGTPPFRLGGTRNCTTCCNSNLGTGHTVDMDVSSDGVHWVNGTGAMLFSHDTPNPSVSFGIGLRDMPTAVRHTHGSIWPQCALYSSEGLPAFPFQLILSI